MASVESDHSLVQSADELIAAGHRYVNDLPLPNGRKFRLKVPKWNEVKQCLTFPVTMHFQAVACISWVDSHGDTLLPLSEEGVAKFDQMDAPIADAILEAVKLYCLNGINYEEAVKN